MEKNIWIVANWKSNKTIAEALDWISKVGPEIPRMENLKVVVCPTFSCLSEVKKAIQVGNFPIMVGSQDISSFDVGAYTGEESAVLLKELISLSIIGHSERRENFSETDEIVSKKVEQALKSSITALVCVQGSDTPLPSGVKVVAYEPVFAIGTGTPDTPENANTVSKALKGLYGNDLEVLYGGSVTPGNVKSYLNQEGINGVLIGKASLDTEEFIKIVKECAVETN